MFCSMVYWLNLDEWQFKYFQDRWEKHVIHNKTSLYPKFEMSDNTDFCRTSGELKSSEICNKLNYANRKYFLVTIVVL